MSSDEPVLAFGPFIRALEEHFHSLTQEELIETMLSIAGAVSPLERTTYLNKALHGPKRAAREIDIDTLLARIENISGGVIERREAIEDGSYWDEYSDDEEYEDYDWHEPPSTTKDQIEAITSVFIEVDTLFLDGEYKSAARAYRPLLSLFDDRYTYEPTLDLRERRARYIRSVYLSSSADNRLDEMIDIMCRDEEDKLSYIDYAVDFDDEWPTFIDVIDAAPDELPDLKAFLKDWVKRFRNAVRARNQVLYLEAVLLNEGVEGLSEVARRWGGTRPRGYTTWIGQLLENSQWRDAVSASREALSAIPDDGRNTYRFRQKVAAGYLYASEKLGDEELVFDAARTAFSIDPSDTTLIKFLHVAGKRRDDALTMSISVLTSRESTGALLIKTFLMAGRIEETYEKVLVSEPVGWSHGSNPGGLCFAAILAMHVQSRLDDFPAIKTLLAGYAGAGDPEYFETGSEAESTRYYVYEEIRRGLGSAVLYAGLLSKYLDWATETGMLRIDHIVSNTYRNAYRRAALVLAALYERHIFDDNVDAAKELVDHYRSRYNRHVAFKRELNAVLPGE